MLRSRSCHRVLWHCAWCRPPRRNGHRPLGARSDRCVGARSAWTDRAMPPRRAWDHGLRRRETPRRPGATYPAIGRVRRSCRIQSAHSPRARSSIPLRDRPRPFHAWARPGRERDRSACRPARSGRRPFATRASCRLRKPFRLPRLPLPSCGSSLRQIAPTPRASRFSQGSAKTLTRSGVQRTVQSLKLVSSPLGFASPSPARPAGGRRAPRRAPSYSIALRCWSETTIRPGDPRCMR